MSNDNPQKRKPMRLPFDNRKKNGGWAAWIYDHRTGVLTTIIIYLVGTITFLSYRIVINKAQTEMIAIEFEKEPEKEIPPTPEQIKAKMIEELHEKEATRAANKISNENSKFNTSLKDSKKSNAQEIYKEADRVTRELADGKAAYEKGLKEIQESAKRKPKPTQQADSKSENSDKVQTQMVKGDVFVSYNLVDRNHVYLHVPAYQCQYGGTVVVQITVNRSGKVTAANVDKATSSSDGCIVRMAEQSALASTFNTSPTAPDRQQGTITYRFVSQ